MEKQYRLNHYKSCSNHQPEIEICWSKKKRINIYVCEFMLYKHKIANYSSGYGISIKNGKFSIFVQWSMSDEISSCQVSRTGAEWPNMQGIRLDGRI